MIVITPVTHDLGAFTVRRTLPAKTRTMVGPFIFVDQFGPARLEAGAAMDVRPHPHINLATVTYLFKGAIGHRDSLGTNKVIEPGAINLMTAGSGIVHSERTPMEARATGSSLYGMQTWLALRAALGMHDAAARGHKVHLSRANGREAAETVPVVDRAFEQPGHGGEVDVRVRAHVHALARGEARGAELVDEDERPDHRPRPRRQRAAHLEVAEIVGDRGDGLENGHSPSSSG